MAGRGRQARIAPLVTVLGLALVAPGASPAPVDRAAVRDWRDLAGTTKAPAVARREVVVVLRAAPAALRPGSMTSRAAFAAAVHDQALALQALAERGFQLKVRAHYARVLNAFVVDALPDGMARLAADPDVAAVFPVRAYSPAGIVADALPGLGPGLRPYGTSKTAGSGITVALLDGPIDYEHPLLQGTLVREGPGLAHGGQDAAASHATAMAAIVAGHDGPGGLVGVAPAATVLPLDVLRPAADGSLQATTRTLLFGLERASDPNNDGVLDDRAEVVLAPITARFASFRDSAEERAVAALDALGAVVVAPTGNDGPSGLAAGTTGAPAGAAGVLAVGAMDGRPMLPRIALTVAGEPADAALAGPVAPPAGLVLPVRIPNADGSGAEGAAALVERAGGDLRAQAVAAAQAGAQALLLWGHGGLPAGALGVDDRLALPILALDEAAGQRIATLVGAGSPVDVSFGVARGDPNTAVGRVADFSSTGLGGDGRVKPDLITPGVTVVTALPGGGLTSVTGTSAASAQAAGLVAALAGAHPRWDPARLRATLIGSAQPVADGVAAQGGGAAYLDGAQRAQLLASPATVAFGHIGRSTGAAKAALLVQNTTQQPLVVHVGWQSDVHGGATVTASPAAFALTPGAAVPLEVTLRLAAGPLAGDAVGGWITLTVDGGQVLRVPAAAIVTSPAPRLLRALAIEPAQSGAGPTIAATVGEVRSGSTGEVRITGVERLVVDVERGGRRLGRAYEARQLLPGRYRFALPAALVDGEPLAPGRYALRVTATGPDGTQTVARVRVTIPAPG